MVNVPLTIISPCTLFDNAREGRKFIPYFNLDFSANPSYSFDLTNEFNNGQFTSWQGIYVDNHPNNQVVTLTNLVTQQHMDFAANTLGFYHILQPYAPAKFTIASGGNSTINIALYNFALEPLVWSP